MKKIYSFLLLFFISAPVFAEIFFEPQWSEFCPKRFVDINSTRWHYTSSGRYWANRKKVFEERLAKCNSLSDESREACYNTLRQMENRATEIHNGERGSSALKYMMINTMF